MTYDFRTDAKSEKSNHGRQDFVAHVKYTLTNDNNPDAVLCLIVRQSIDPKTTVEELHGLADRKAEIIRPALERIADEHDILEPRE